MESLKKTFRFFGPALLFLVLTLSFFQIYKNRVLEGNINYHMLTSEHFGIPDDLVKHGLQPLNYSAVGWDGQFYYFMANDLLGHKETTKHIDVPSYRYQRVGLSLYSAILAKITGQSWVSPAFFFYSYLLLLTVATGVGAILFSARGLSPYVVLLWSLSAGVQMTLYNALPDAAADAFLLMALAALYWRRAELASIAFIFSSLSREAYVLFPACIILFYILRIYQENGFIAGRASAIKATFHTIIRKPFLLWMTLPIAIRVGWTAYLTKHFGISPSSEAGGILGKPLQAWWQYFRLAVTGHHPIRLGWESYAEAMSLVIFLAILLITLLFSTLVICKNYKKSSPLILGISLSCIFLVILYSCFSPVVIIEYTGYMKAVNVFIICLLFIVNDLNLLNKTKTIILILFAFCYLLVDIYFVGNRIMSSFTADVKYTHTNLVHNTHASACSNDYSANIHVKGMHIYSNRYLPIWLSNQYAVVSLTVKNTSSHPFLSSSASGGVFMSNQMLDQQNHVVQDGVRSAIVPALNPGEERDIQVVIPMPLMHGEHHVVFSPVQEDCAWFYQANPQGTTQDMTLNFSTPR